MVADASMAAPGAGLDAQVMAEVSVSLGELTRLAVKRQQYLDRCQRAIRSVPLNPQQFTVTAGVFTIKGNPNEMGPNTGYAWAVQRLTLGGLATGATPDIGSFYRGPSSSATVENTQLLATVNGNQPYWHPGRTGLIVEPGDTIIAAGSTAATTGTVTLTGEVILMEQWLLPEFLL